MEERRAGGYTAELAGCICASVGLSGFNAGEVYSVYIFEENWIYCAKGASLV